jgi:ABC-type sugar transport system ATPase subunit
MSDTPLLSARGIEKIFDRTRALACASLEVRAGEVHGLLGANGAGKSTLSRVLSGQVRHDRGEIFWRGAPYAPRRPREAIEAGIGMVMQETSLAPDLTVLENIFLPALARPGGFRPRAFRAQAEAILEGLGQAQSLPLEAEVRSLSAAQRQLVEIAKTLAMEAALIIFDEPTASLSPGEVERLFDIITRLREEGRGIVFVSHRLEEVFAITDRVTVLREGRTVAASIPTASLTQAELIRLMAGQDVSGGSTSSRTTTHGQEVVLEARHLAAPPKVRDVSFTLHRGEILGLGGLVGAGRSETLEILFGLRAPARGEIRLEGRPFAPRRPREAIRAGLALVPEDRRGQSIVPDLSVQENLFLAHLAARRGFGVGLREREAEARRLLERLDLPAGRLDEASMLAFSGGMQQKIILARWLLLKPRVLLLDEPTKGVDIGTRRSIYDMLREVAASGTAVLVVSSDFEELLELCTRIVVISDGTTIADVESALLDETKLTLFAAPRSSMGAVSSLLAALVAEYGGVAFWGLIDGSLSEGGRFYCLARVGEDSAAEPGFRAGETPLIAATRIPAALSAPKEGFVREAGGSPATLLVPVKSHRGHALGWIGLSLAGASLPDPAPLRQRIGAVIAHEM